jgi:hypothetical protein
MQHAHSEIYSRLSSPNSASGWIWMDRQRLPARPNQSAISHGLGSAPDCGVRLSVRIDQPIFSWKCRGRGGGGSKAQREGKCSEWILFQLHWLKLNEPARFNTLHPALLFGMLFHTLFIVLWSRITDHNTMKSVRNLDSHTTYTPYIPYRVASPKKHP